MNSLTWIRTVSGDNIAWIHVLGGGGGGGGGGANAAITLLGVGVDGGGVCAKGAVCQGSGGARAKHHKLNPYL